MSILVHNIGAFIDSSASMADETLLNNLIDNLNALLVLNDQMQHSLKRIYENLDKQPSLLMQLQDFTDDALPLCDKRRFTCFPGDDSDLGLAITVSSNSGSSESKQEVVTCQLDVVESPLYPTLMPSLGNVKPTCLPRLSGDNPDKWITKAIGYFDHYAILDTDQFPYISSYVDDKEFPWLNWMHNTFQLNDWSEFSFSLVKRFGYQKFAAITGIVELQSKPPPVANHGNQVDAISIGLIFAPVTSLETIYLAQCHEQHDSFNHRFDSPTSLAPKLNVVLAPNVIVPFPFTVIKIAGDFFKRNLVVCIVAYAAILIDCCQSGSTRRPFTFHKTNDTSTKLFQWIDTGWVVTPLAVQVSVWHKWKTNLASTTTQFSWMFFDGCSLHFIFLSIDSSQSLVYCSHYTILEKFGLEPRLGESALSKLLRDELPTFGHNDTHEVLKSQVKISTPARLTSVISVNIQSVVTFINVLSVVTFNNVLGYSAYFAPLDQGLQLLIHVFKSGMDFYLSVRILLVSFYAKLGYVNDFYMSFDSVHTSNVVSYTSMINGFPQRGYRKVLILLVKMNTSSFGYLEAKHLVLHHFIRHGFDKNAWIPHPISFKLDDKLQWYGFMATKEALDFFYNFVKRNVITNDRHLLVFYLLAIMLLILDFRQRILSSICFDNGTERPIQHYGCTVDLLRQGQMVLETVKLLYKIPRNVDLKNLGALLKGCGSLEIIVVATKTLKMLLKGALQCAKPINPIVATVLLSKHVKCVAIAVTFKVFNSRKTNGNLAWNTMLMGLRMHGHDNNAPLDEYGVPKWDFLKQFHKAIQLYAVFLVATDPPTSFLGQNLKARVYKPSSTCASFLEPGITSFVALYGHKPPNIACYFHHSPGRATTWKDIFGLLHGLLDLHLEDKVKLKEGGNVMNNPLDISPSRQPNSKYMDPPNPYIK